MRAFRVLLTASAIALAAPAASQTLAPVPEANPQIDYDKFVELSAQLAETREAHLLGLADFIAKAAEPDAIILDARSAAAFEAGHIEGAINLPFSDFTDEKLAKILGTDQTRPILIYCNNNFSDARPPIALKRIELALNIPTFINLHGYGYTNVWELADVVAVADVDWTGDPWPVFVPAPKNNLPVASP